MISTPRDLPCDLRTWYPALRGPLHCGRVLEASHPHLRKELRAAWKDLEPGHSVVLYRPAGRAAVGKRALRHLTRTLDHVERIESFTIFPNTGGSHVFLPDDRGTVVYREAMRLLPSGRKRWRIVRALLPRVRALSLQRLLPTGELTLVTKGPCQANCSEKTAVATFFANNALAVASGVPGPLQKLTVMAISQAGEPEGFVKIAANDLPREQIRREVRALEHLRDLALTSARVPRLLGRGEVGQTSFLVQEVLAGIRSPDELGSEHLRFLDELRTRTVQAVPLGHLARFQEDEERLSALRDDADPDWWNTFACLHDRLVAHWGARPVPCTLAHGDFTPWNLMCSEGQLAAFDWEFWEERAPLLHDAFHFQFQTGVLVRHDRGTRLHETLSRALGDTLARSLAEHELDALDGQALLGLYVLHTALRDEMLNRIERPCFDQVEWQRTARTAVAALVSARLSASTAKATFDQAQGLAA